MVRKGQQLQQHTRRNTIGHLFIDLGKILFGAVVVAVLPILMGNMEMELQTGTTLGFFVASSVGFWIVGCLTVK
jgi:hypothetical protein